MKRKRGELKPKWTQGDLAAAIYPNQDDARETRKGDISKLENGKVANPNTTTINKIADALGITDEQIDALHKQAQMSPAEQLNNLDTLPRDTLELLASRFEIETPHALTDHDLLSVLTKKAEEYRSYRALIDGLDDRVAAIANLKGAAQDAADRLDFEKVEELLSRVDTVETKIGADTKQARAANALQRGRAQQAYDILTAAADSFASIDRREPSRRRNAYSKMLYDYGLRFAGDAMGLAAQMSGKAATDVDRTKDANLWAMTQNNLGTALQTLGERDGDTARLEQAVQAYKLALQECTQDKLPLDWAMTQNNLGNALQTLGQRDGDTARLEQAVQACELALQERTQDKLPLDWAMTQGNLGGIYLTYFDITPDLADLDRAQTHVQAALSVFEAAAPYYAGMAQQLLQQIAERRGDG